MQTEIILFLDNELVQKADRWAKAHSVSLNDAIATFLEQLPDLDRPLVSCSTFNLHILDCLLKSSILPPLPLSPSPLQPQHAN